MQDLSEDLRTLLSSRAQWWDLAIVLSDANLTQAECARALGVGAGTISRPLREMWEADLLKVDSDEPERGSRYWLPDEVKELLEDEAALRVQVGKLQEGHAFLAVQVEKLLDLARALQASDLTQSVAWVAELTGDHRFLVVFEKSVSTIHRNRLEAAIEAGGGRCSTVQIAKVMSGNGWRRMLAASRDAAAAAGL